MGRTFRNLIIVTLVTSAALLAPLESVSAFKTSGYVVKTRTFAPNSADIATGKLSCPSGDSIVSGGARWVVTGTGVTATEMIENTTLSASLPLSAHTWYAAGFREIEMPVKLRIVIACLPSSTVGKYTKNGVHFNEDGAGNAGGYVPCGGGQQIVTGGAGWRVIGDPYVASMAREHRITSSSPTIQADGWYSAGYDVLHANDAVLETVALCRPASAVGPYMTKYATSAPGSGTATVGVSCPTGWRVVAQGAFWHDGSDSPDPTLSHHYRLSGAVTNTTLGSATGYGYSYASGGELTTVIHCRAK